MKTLLESTPREFSLEYTDTLAYRYKDVEVKSEHYSHINPWQGPHKNVHVWWELANGKIVGWNENPSRGWSFPVMNSK